MLVIAIPIYKESPSELDLMSIDRIIDVFDDSADGYEMVYFCPKNLNTSKYPRLEALRYDDWYFTNRSTYSKLCMSHELYRDLNALCDDAEENYMLLYQTDCYIPLFNISKDEFHAKLKSVVDKGYDYVGAPIFGNPLVNQGLPTVGNGGCSLRKLSKFMEITHPDSLLNSPPCQEFIEKHPRKDFYQWGEDVYFCEFVPSIVRMNFPSLNEACHFAWDEGVEKLYSLGVALPLFIHACWKYRHFWAKHIPEIQ